MDNISMMKMKQAKELLTVLSQLLTLSPQS